jgi:hypothetical protein
MIKNIIIKTFFKRLVLYIDYLAICLLTPGYLVEYIIVEHTQCLGFLVSLRYCT